MAAITADAWVSSSGKATIKIWSDEPWTSTAWSIQGSLKDFPGASWTNLYSLWRQSGNGYVDGSWLVIEIDSCPEGPFILTFQHGEKIFILSEGKITFGSTLVGLNDHLKPYTYEAGDFIVDNTLKKAFVFFGGDLKPFKGRVTGQLQKDGELHCILGGNAVDWVVEQGSNELAWSIPAMIFTEFYWLKEPSSRTEYKMVFREQNRSGGQALRSFQVEMDKDRIYSPLTNSVYNVAGDHQFNIALRSSLKIGGD